MRASEYGIKRLTAAQVEFKVDTEIFGEELQAMGIHNPTFVAHLYGEEMEVRHKTSKRDYTGDFDTEELLQDILFAALNEPTTFFGGESQ